MDSKERRRQRREILDNRDNRTVRRRVSASNKSQRVPLRDLSNMSTPTPLSSVDSVGEMIIDQENISPNIVSGSSLFTQTPNPSSSLVLNLQSQGCISSKINARSTSVSRFSVERSTVCNNIASSSNIRFRSFAKESVRVLDFDDNLEEGSDNANRVQPSLTSFGSQVTNIDYSKNILSESSDTNIVNDTAVQDVNVTPNHIEENVGRGSKHLRRYFAAWNFGGPTFECSHCKAWMWYEERLDKRTTKTKKPKFGLCCNQGKIKLPPLRDPPKFLKDLLEEGVDPRGPKFREVIRQYNCSLAFTSNGGKIDRSINDGRGPPTFRINGLNHHLIGSLLPKEGDRPKFSQLYIFDTPNEIDNRLSVVNGRDRLDPAILRGLVHMLEQNNPFCRVFRMAKDRVTAANRIPVRLKLIGTRSKDGRQYNIPTASEVAALLVAGDEDVPSNRDIILEEQSGSLHRITELHPAYMPLQYPLIFPHGEDGYYTDILHADTASSSSNSSKLSQCDWFRYRIMFRRDQFNTILRCGRLTQQFFCDAWTSILSERANWVENNQQKLRAHVFQGLEDAVCSGDTDADAVGVRVVLPSSFTGSPRYMIQAYQDCMAIVRWAGPPDLFLTFTTNPKWPEIREGLKKTPGASLDDRHDLYTRVFKIKLDQLIYDITKGEHFGRSRAVVYTVEFQKRGLPHAHIALFLSPSDKPKDADAIDRIISAELPDPQEDPVGFEAVSQFMLHGPCGTGFTKSPCMVDGKCDKHFPKKYQTHTTLSADGFPVYMRRKNGRVAKAKGVELDNSWVVPHNVDLCVKYNAHINVEFCNQSRCIKYLFKYMCKGEDRATLMIEDNITFNEATNSTEYVRVDELAKFLTCSYFSGSESTWRTLKFPIQYREPAVERLNFHLPNEQVVIFRENDTVQKVLNRPNVEKTILTEWFRANQRYEDARGLTFVDFPTKFVWNKSKKEWTPRQKGNTIGRLYYAHPSGGERYYLRVLLNVVKGARSFEEVRTVDGVLYETFKEACKALGLLQGDSEWHETLREASIWATGNQLRDLFVTILLFCEVVDVRRLWEQNIEILSDDILFLKRKSLGRDDLELSTEQIREYALFEIEKIMNKNARSLRDFSSMPFPSIINPIDEKDALIMDELSYDRAEQLSIHEELIVKLNNDQRAVYEAVIQSVMNGSGGFFFVYGSGGTGKTFLWRSICATLRSKGKIVLSVASSGIAALLLDGGRTAHSRFKIPIRIEKNSTCAVYQGTPLAHLLRRTSLVIWDEAPMAHRYAFEAVDRMLRDIMRPDIPDAELKVFGGLPVLLGGDFRQILPVVPKWKRGDIVSASISRSVIWEDCRLFTLSINMRVRDSDSESVEDFKQWLLKLGDGRLPIVDRHVDPESFLIDIPDQFLIPSGPDSIREIVDHTYPNLEENFKKTGFLKDRAILSPTNETVDEVNDYVLSRIPGEPKTYLSADRIDPGSGNAEEMSLLYPTEFLNSLKFTGIPNHSIVLKEGVPIILLRNINQNEGLCNGTRMIVIKMHARVIEAEIVTGRNVGRCYFIPRVEITPSDSKWPFAFSRRQFPIKVCFAMTINKSQGQTFNSVGVYLPKPVFTHGQLYVAASRVTSPKGLKILVDHGDEDARRQTDNVVFQEVFDDVFQR